MFLYNYWYVAAMGHELGREPLARTLLNEAVVMFRKEDGTPVALEDRCVHRAAPLSLGRLDGDTLVCSYHGLTFDCEGGCVRVPGQSQVPPEARVRAYPVVENSKWVWIWMGDPAKADPAQVPDLEWVDGKDWRLVYDLMGMKGDYRLLIDNLMDLSHLTFLHARTIGVDDVAKAPINTSRTDGGVKVERWMMKSAVAPMIAQATGLKSPVDRWQICQYTPPSTILIDIGTVPGGADPAEAEGGSGIKHWVLNLITPETDRSTHYFWGFTRNYAMENEQAQKFIYDQLELTFVEDVEMIEGQQRMIDARPDGLMVDISYDAGPMQTRRLMERLAEEEKTGARAA